MQDVLAGYAANGVMVHYLDLTLVGSNHRQSRRLWIHQHRRLHACAACVTDSNYANQFLFYVDALHLTSAGSGWSASILRRSFRPR